MAISDYNAYVIHTAVNLHFSSDGYDAFKYQFKVRRNRDNFEKSGQRFMYGKIANRLYNPDEAKKFFAAFAARDIKWVGEIADNTKVWPQVSAFTQSMTYNMQNLLSDLSMDYPDFYSLFTTGSRVPKLQEMYNDGQLSIEELVVLNKLTGFAKHFESESLVWASTGLTSRILCYTPFIEVNTKKLEKIVLERFEMV